MVNPMSTLLTDLGLVVTNVIGMVGDVAGEVVTNPILLIGFGVGLLGAGVAMFRKFAK